MMTDSSLDPFSGDFVGDDPKKLLLCPVRALRSYLKRTQHLRPDCRRLFVSTGRNKKDVSKNTISFWLSEVIRRAYSSASPSYADIVHAKAHDFRGLGPTIAFKKNLSVLGVPGFAKPPSHLT